ncbi:helix-turn-helix domain-containing protein [Paraburkholderia youngii]|nr:helix-turn-helix domain-containing protein [Paraburkholderia youngii]
MQVDPANRLVADSLESEWNQALRALTEAQDHYEKQREADRAGLNDKQRANIMTLARDFPRLWNDPRTPDRERKRMARLLIADATLLKGADICVQIRFNGGATHTLHVPLSKPAWILRQTPRAVIAEMDRLLNEYTESETAEQLNRQGLASGWGKRFTSRMITRLRLSHKLPSHHDRLRARGMLTLDEIAERLNVMPTTIKTWRRAGLLIAHRYDDKGGYLFEPPGAEAPVKFQHQGKTRGRRSAA